MFLSPTTAALSYAVKDVTEGAEYEFRVAAINESGAGDPSPPSAMVCAKNPNSKFTPALSVAGRYRPELCQRFPAGRRFALKGCLFVFLFI